RKNPAQQRREKRLRGRGDAGARQGSAILQSPRQGLHSGSLRDSGEQVACRPDLEILRQAVETLATSSRGVKRLDAPKPWLAGTHGAGFFFEFSLAIPGRNAISPCPRVG